jgi:hypothetical protein
MLSCLLAFIFVVVNMAAHMPAQATIQGLSAQSPAGGSLTCLAEPPASLIIKDDQPAGNTGPDTEINHCIFHFIFMEPTATGYVSLAGSTRLILSGKRPESLYPDIGKKPPRPSV